MGGYLASREVLTAADRRQQTMQARDIRQMCVSPDLIPVTDTCVRPFVVLRFGRPFVVFSPSAGETLSASGRSLSVTHPPLPCVLSGEGFLLRPVRSRACAGLLFVFRRIR